MYQDKKAVARLGDATSHGGRIITASSACPVMGIVAALEGDMTICPKCKGTYPILPTPGAGTMNGKTFAHHNTETACGATLIASL
ncbi:MAG: PAAR domain-containing protein [Undibacterium curvum]|jgi:uncharacterized Zn-binding protein involved in type VI secretion|uniref:PAAR domain-containing protein n=1 Tax=Undibacterium curvum TaxID=2762294 RepID=UPI003BE76A44